jgi:hypothetical protein
MKFTQNEGNTDRLIRAIVGVAFLLSGFYFFTGIPQIVVYIVGVVMLATAGTGFCGLYTVFHINTKKK